MKCNYISYCSRLEKKWRKECKEDWNQHAEDSKYQWEPDMLHCRNRESLNTTKKFVESLKYTTKKFVDTNFVRSNNDDIGSEKHCGDYSYARNMCPCFKFYFILK